jgi:hypothetical protein
MFQGLLSKCTFEEAHDFHNKLPLLLKDEAFFGKYVVFKHGIVHAVADSFGTAYIKALNLFGTESPFYVGIVGDTELFKEDHELKLAANG